MIGLIVARSKNNVIGRNGEIGGEEIKYTRTIYTRKFRN